MRAHRQIIEDAGGDRGIVNALGEGSGVTVARVRFWRRRNSIPAEWWSRLARTGVASLDELARAVAADVDGHDGGSGVAEADLVAPTTADGAGKDDAGFPLTARTAGGAA